MKVIAPGFMTKPFDHVSLTGIGKVMKLHMCFYEPCDTANTRFIAPPPRHHLGGYARPRPIMTVIRIAAVTDAAYAGRPFSHIMEKSGITKRQIGRCI